MYGNQGGGDSQSGYGGQQNYGNPQQPQQQGKTNDFDDIILIELPT